MIMLRLPLRKLKKALKLTEIIRYGVVLGYAKDLIPKVS